MRARVCDSVLFVRGGLGVRVVLLCISAMNVICTIQLNMFKYQQWRTDYIVLYVRDLLTDLVILSDTNV